MKCGVTTGTVILLEGDDYVGHAVNVAARLCDLAVGQEVLAVASVVPELPPWATVEQPTPSPCAGSGNPSTSCAWACPDRGPDTAPRPDLPHPAHPRPRPWPAAPTTTGGSCCSAPRAAPRCGTSGAHRDRFEVGSIREVWMR